MDGYSGIENLRANVKNCFLEEELHKRVAADIIKAVADAIRRIVPLSDPKHQSFYLPRNNGVGKPNWQRLPNVRLT